MDSGFAITRLLRTASRGDGKAIDEVVSVLYEDLCAIARRQLRREESGHTLDTSAVVHEAYFRLHAMEGFEWQNRSHFFGVAGMIMRRVLVRHARERKAAKRGGGAQPVPLTHAELFTESQADQLLALDELLDGLDVVGSRCRSVVECRIFAGMTLSETAEWLGVSPATVKRDWQIARAWLNDALSDPPARAE